MQKEFQGPEGSGTDPLWRLGAQGHRLGFLRRLTALPDPPDSVLVWEYVPIRENKYLSDVQRSFGPRRRFCGRLALGVRCSGVAGGDNAAGAALGARAVAACGRLAHDAAARRRDRSGSVPEIPMCATPSM